MTTDVLFVTYHKDIDWFKQSLANVRKNLSGYRNIIVFIQDVGNQNVFDELMATNPEIRWWVGENPWHGKGYWQQQVLKMNADTYSDADAFIIFDSDLFLKGPVSVDDFGIDGKPGWLWAYYDSFTQDVPWRPCTEKATGLDCPRELMQATPFWILRETFQMARQHIKEYHGIELDTYVKQEANAGRRFSEFNCMGRIAYEFQQDRYAFMDRNADENGVPGTSHWPKGVYSSRQFWSRAPVTDHLPEIMSMIGIESDGLKIETTKEGWWVCSEDTHFRKWVIDRGRLDHDTAFLAIILPYVKPGMTVVDCGANIGTHTIAYAKATAGVDGGRVFAFEPNPLPFECLRRNMVGHGHVEVFNSGLGAHAGHAGMEMSANVGASYMVPGEGFSIMPLDQLALTRLDFMKIDCEGMEMAVLLGAAKTIAQFRPTMVIEMNPGALARNGVVCEDIYSFLRLRGYDILGHQDSDQYDIIAVPIPPST